MSDTKRVGLTDIARGVIRGVPDAPSVARGLYRLATDFGADPTGKIDASDAIEKALTTIWAHPPAQASSGQWMMPVRLTARP